MAKKIGTETVTVRRVAKTDRLATPNPASPAEHDITGCVIMPRTSNEQDKGWTIVEGRTVFAPYGSDIQADDQVMVPDSPDWFEVDGQPGDYKNAGGRGKVTIFYLKRRGT